MFLKKWSDNEFKMQFFNICPRKGSYSMAILVQPFLKVKDIAVNSLIMIKGKGNGRIINSYDKYR